MNAFERALRGGDLAMVRSLLRCGAEVSGTASDGRPMVHLVVDAVVAARRVGSADRFDSTLEVLDWTLAILDEDDESAWRYETATRPEGVSRR